MPSITLSWTNPTTREDGSPLTSPITSRLYEDGQLIVQDIAEPTFSIIDVAEGTRVYTVTTFDEEYRVESQQSAGVTFSLVKPSAPTGLQFEIG